MTFGFSLYAVPLLATLVIYFRTRLRKLSSVVATTRRNSTCDMLTSAKLSVGYLVVGIIRELDKKPSLY